MHPIQKLRRADPELRAALERRPGTIDWELFDQQEAQRRAAQQAHEQALAERRRIAEQVGRMRQQGVAITDPTIVTLQEQGQALAQSLPALAAEAEVLAQAQAAWVNELPNAPLAVVPEGLGEQDNRLVRTVGVPDQSLGQGHAAIAATFEGFDPERASRLSGSRFSVLRGPVATLHRALVQMMLDLHIEAGYEEAYVPYLVRGQTLFGTGQLPKFADDLFKTQDDLYLIPTAEAPVTNLVAGQVLTPADLPLAWVAHTPCFRREAGSAGRDTAGLIRQHQFDKVELVRIEHPARSEQALLDDVLGGATRVLDALELPYRVVELCTGDLGFASQHTFDLEVWMPGQGLYREISSCSNMGEFQARRMDVHLKDGADRLFPHTLNGSGLAVGRSLAAVLENHIQPDGSLRLPERLRAYMGGRSTLLPPVGGLRRTPGAAVPSPIGG